MCMLPIQSNQSLPKNSLVGTSAELLSTHHLLHILKKEVIDIFTYKESFLWYSAVCLTQLCLYSQVLCSWGRWQWAANSWKGQSSHTMNHCWRHPAQFWFSSIQVWYCIPLLMQCFLPLINGVPSTSNTRLLQEKSHGQSWRTSRHRNSGADYTYTAATKTDC